MGLSFAEHIYEFQDILQVCHWWLLGWDSPWLWMQQSDVSSADTAVVVIMLRPVGEFFLLPGNLGAVKCCRKKNIASPSSASHIQRGLTWFVQLAWAWSGWTRQWDTLISGRLGDWVSWGSYALKTKVCKMFVEHCHKKTNKKTLNSFCLFLKTLLTNGSLTIFVGVTEN